MTRKTYEIGEKVYFKDTGNFAGEVLGVNEIYWSGDEYRLITYYIKPEEGFNRRVSSEELLEVPVEKC